MFGKAARTVLVRLALIFLVLLPAGCKSLPGLEFLSSSEPAPAVAADAGGAEAEAVKFRVGDQFAFDNPFVRWEVVSVEGDRVRWRSDTGDEQVTRLNILLPALEWRSRTAGTGRRFIRDEVGSLFPMKVGATLSFRSTVTTSKPPFGWEHQWSCNVTGQEDVKVLNNLFETFVVACGREKPDEIVFYYAPKVGHYVVQRTAGADGNPDRTRNLLSFKRSDGTTIADVVKSPSDPVAAVVSAGTLPDGKAPGPVAGPVPAPSTSPSRVAAPVNGAPSTAGGVPSIRAAVDSVTLRAPEFGGNATPPASPARPAAAPVAPVVPEAMPRPGAKPASAGSGTDRAASTGPRADRLLKSEYTGPRAFAVPPARTRSPVAAMTPRVPPPAVPPPPPAVPPPVAVTPTPPAVPPPSALATVPAPPVPVPVAKVSPEMPVVSSLQIPTPVSSQGPVPVAAPLAKAPVPVPVKAVPPPIPVVPPVAATSPVTETPAVPQMPAIPETVHASEPSGEEVHLASYRNLASARRGWDQLIHRNGDLLDGLHADIRRIEIDSRGVYYRLYAGPVDHGDAAALCEKLRTRGVFCAPQDG